MTLLALLFALLPLAGPALAETLPFEQLHCMRYAAALDLPATTLVRGADPNERQDLPFMICAARRGDDVVVLDAGYVDEKYGAELGAVDWIDITKLLGEVGIDAKDVDLVTLSHLHWDHAGGTDRFPNARFVVQRRELAFAATDMAGNKFAANGFRVEEVLDAVRLNWEGRLDLVDGDVEGYRPGLDLYFTPGHTSGTMTVCLETTKGRVCYASDAVYTYRNIDEQLDLAISLLPFETFRSYDKIRRVMRGGTLIPGHDPALFSRPADFGFRKVSDRVIAIVE